MNEILFSLFTFAVGILFGTSILAIFSDDVRSRLRLKMKTAKVSAVVLFCLVLVSMWFETPTMVGDHVYIERDLLNRKQTIHSSSSCVKIKKGYDVSSVKSYTYMPYIDQFCPKCMYESDAVKLAEKK